ncbi:MAG: aminotransferase class I/II-fold pyridoxal phosphate-dependent enzyme [Bacteroidia bacterium]|nr:aminotransferase class I/II-fold pyridoxal phosphate-dependent enzyme [Bacteroidia bacterium]
MENVKTKTRQKTRNHEKLNLRHFISSRQNNSLESRVQGFYLWLETLKKERELNYHRLVNSAPGREVLVRDFHSGKDVRLKMFASNNYLGLANHPYVIEQVLKAIKKFGIGLGGPALLNGYTSLMKELEERISDLKHQEETMIFSSGYNTNLGLLQALVRKDDFVVYDELSHASFYDGLKLSGASAKSFKHNSVEGLEEILRKQRSKIKGQIFIGVEGVYSMDGDLSPLPEIIECAQRYDALLILDDAHGTGVIGNRGSGTAEHFGLSTEVDISMGTFSKAFSMTGGFLSASKELVSYMRYFARSYMFSASLPPSMLAAVIAGLDIMEREPWRQEKLQDLLSYARKKFSGFKLAAYPEAAIIALSAPSWMDIRKANYKLYKHGVFVNAVEYPAVPIDQQRFRISLMADHSKSDIDFLVDAITAVWNDPSLEKNHSKF